MPKLLIIDDDHDMHELIHCLFDGVLGYTVTSADCAAKGLLSIINENPDIVILDVNLNDKISGFDIYNVINRHPAFKHIHLIIVTGTEYGVILKNTNENLPDSELLYLIKPINPSILFTTISNVALRDALLIRPFS